MNLSYMKSSKLKCVLIEDSAMQRRTISKLIKDNTSLFYLDEFRNGQEAKVFLADNDVDLIFLDIEMPIVNGFDLLESLEEKPQIIVISASAHHAMKAFDYNVADYLQKPVDKKRFDNAVKKALTNFRLENIEETEQDFIYINHQLKNTKLILNDILWVEAYGDYIKIISKDKNMLILSTMKAFNDQLPSDKFLRIHKSFIVNLDKIDKFNGSSVEIDGKIIPLSRHKKELLQNALVVVE
ncbi:DNA-binding response regulator [Arenibacter certesii]|uniref:DNA-binding response regulator n=2 Tax=Arenibacter certesii TaxID=228955 RepID=A0A918IUL3_9FLAO|nr:DNA-binding response regulator [Arenibacter certesii]